MDAIQLYQDFSIPYKTEGHKHCRPGWVNVVCPFCSGNPGWHLSYNLAEDYYACWRCGFHPVVTVISKLLKLSLPATYAVIKQYGVLSYSQRKTTTKVKIRRKAFKFPSNAEPLSEKHKKYLESRNFDPDKVEREWNLLGTGVFSRLDDLSYKNRILIPFEWNGEQVSFDSRDITGKAQNKYMACPKERELIEHKHILYGNQTQWTDTGICVEGPTDVWRLGGKAFATSGIKYTMQQVRAMRNSFKRIAVVYDDESQAVAQAKKLVADLRFRGVDAFRIDIEGDPGAMKEDDAKHLINSIL